MCQDVRRAFLREGFSKSGGHDSRMAFLRDEVLKKVGAGFAFSLFARGVLEK